MQAKFVRNSDVEKSRCLEKKSLKDERSRYRFLYLGRLGIKYLNASVCEFECF